MHRDRRSPHHVEESGCEPGDGSPSSPCSCSCWPRAGSRRPPSPSAEASEEPEAQRARAERVGGHRPSRELSYPEDGPAECGAEATDTHDAYTGNIEQIRAEDELTVVFDLCNPDVAFLSKVAFTSFAINDADYLEAHAEDGSLVEEPNGTGPYVLEAWNRGSEITLSANPRLLGRRTAVRRP